MSSTVNNFFESIVNSTNPHYIGEQRPVFIAPSNMEGLNMTNAASNPLPSMSNRLPSIFDRPNI